MPRSQATLYADENLCGAGIISQCQAENIPLQPITRLIARSASDEEVLRAIGAHRGSLLITRDDDFLFRRVTHAAMRAHRTGVFYIACAGTMSAGQVAALIIRHWPAMKRIAARMRRPFLYSLTKNGPRQHTITRDV